MKSPAGIVWLFLFSNAAAASVPLVFGANNAWTVVDRNGRVIMHLHEVCGQRANELAVGADQRTLVFTAWSEPVENWLLYACDQNRKPRLLGERIGYHAQPSFSPDGIWVFFVHHPRKGGPPGQHDPGANAQVYRVRLDGSGLESLTESAGCKLAPRSVGSTVVYLHSTCEGPRSIEMLDSNKGLPTTLLEHGAMSHYPDLSPDGSQVLFTRKVLFAVELHALDVKTRETKLLWRLPKEAWDARASWGSDGSILYQRDGAVWKVSLKPPANEARLTTIGGAS